MAKRLKQLVVHCAAAVALLSPLPSFAQAVPEHDLKAAFIFNFMLFTEWPAETGFESGALNVCIDDGNPLRQPLAALANKMVKGRKLMVRQPGNADGLRRCHVLVVGNADREHWTQFRKSLPAGGVLVVADDDGPVREGAAISLALEERRVVFDIDLKAVRQARLVLSSKLLRLARSVN